MTFDETKLRDYIDHLPETTQNLVELIGFAQTHRLLAEHGGTKRYVPKEGAPKSSGWAVLSDEAFRKLCGVYAGETIELPKADSVRRLKRDAEIMLLTMRGVSRTQLVKLYGLTQRQIGNIRRRYRMATASSLPV